MNRIPSLRPREIVSALKKAGFREVRQTGSHCILRHDDGREVVVAMHSKTMKRPTMINIIKQAGLTVEGFCDLL